MMILNYDETKKERWDRFVCSNPLAWSGHLSGIFEFEKETTNSENHSLMVVDDSDNIMCLLPLFLTNHKELGFFKTRWLNTGNFLCSGPLFLPELSSKEYKKILELLMQRIIEIAKRLNVDKVWISYPCIIGEETSLNHYGYFPLRHFGYKEQNVISMIKNLNVDDDVLFSSLESACRNMIRRCKKGGGEFNHVLDRKEWLNCYELNVQTLGKKAYTLKAMEILWDEFVEKKIVTVTCIRFETKIISVMVATGINKCFYYWMGFSAKPQVIPGAHNLLVWETMLLYKEKGFRFFEVGSMEFAFGKRENISRFKESFNGIPTYLLSGVLELKPVKNNWFKLLSAIRQSLKRVNI